MFDKQNPPIGLHYKNYLWYSTIERGGNVMVENIMTPLSAIMILLSEPTLMNDDLV